jgi:hypothetical protein
MKTKLFFTALLLAFSFSPALAQTEKTKTAKEETCATKAVEKRDSSLIAALGVYHEDLLTLLQDRKDSLKEIWLSPEKKNRDKEILEVYDTFRAGYRSTASKFNSARFQSWKTFDTEIRACGLTSPESAVGILTAPNSL